MEDNRWYRFAFTIVVIVIIVTILLVSKYFGTKEGYTADEAKKINANKLALELKRKAAIIEKEDRKREEAKNPLFDGVKYDAENARKRKAAEAEKIVLDRKRKEAEAVKLEIDLARKRKAANMVKLQQAIEQKRNQKTETFEHDETSSDAHSGLLIPNQEDLQLFMRSLPVVNYSTPLSSLASALRGDLEITNHELPPRQPRLFDRKNDNIRHF